MPTPLQATLLWSIMWAAGGARRGSLRGSLMWQAQDQSQPLANPKDICYFRPLKPVARNIWPRHFGREVEVRAFIAAQQPDNVPAAQHGAAVRGSRYGSLVRVGENFTNENITPVGRNGSGTGRNQGGRREYPIYIGDEKLTTLVLNAQNELEDTGRA